MSDFAVPSEFVPVGPFIPHDTFSTDGHILSRGLLEIELSDEYAGKNGYYDFTDPNDVRYLTLNIYAVAPEHENGCGRVLLEGCTTVTQVRADTPDTTVRQLLAHLLDQLEEMHELDVADIDPTYTSQFFRKLLGTLSFLSEHDLAS
jgi:hypothetical protein